MVNSVQKLRGTIYRAPLGALYRAPLGALYRAPLGAPLGAPHGHHHMGPHTGHHTVDCNQLASDLFPTNLFLKKTLKNKIARMDCKTVVMIYIYIYTRFGRAGGSAGGSVKELIPIFKSGCDLSVISP